MRQRTTKKKRATTCLVLLMLAVVGHRHTRAQQSALARDHLLGWYKLADRTLIPVFQVDRTYCSVMHPGIEIPLKACPESLEWALVRLS